MLLRIGLSILSVAAIICSLIFVEYAWLCVIVAWFASVFIGRDIDWKAKD